MKRSNKSNQPFEESKGNKCSPNRFAVLADSDPVVSSSHRKSRTQPKDRASPMVRVEDPDPPKIDTLVGTSLSTKFATWKLTAATEESIMAFTNAHKKNLSGSVGTVLNLWRQLWIDFVQTHLFNVIAGRVSAMCLNVVPRIEFIGAITPLNQIIAEIINEHADSFLTVRVSNLCFYIRDPAKFLPVNAKHIGVLDLGATRTSGQMVHVSDYLWLSPSPFSEIDTGNRDTVHEFLKTGSQTNTTVSEFFLPYVWDYCVRHYPKQKINPMSAESLAQLVRDWWNKHAFLLVKDSQTVRELHDLMEFTVNWYFHDVACSQARHGRGGSGLSFFNSWTMSPSTQLILQGIVRVWNRLKGFFADIKSRWTILILRLHAFTDEVADYIEDISDWMVSFYSDDFVVTQDHGWVNMYDEGLIETHGTRIKVISTQSPYADGEDVREEVLENGLVSDRGDIRVICNGEVAQDCVRFREENPSIRFFTHFLSNIPYYRPLAVHLPEAILMRLLKCPPEYRDDYWEMFQPELSDVDDSLMVVSVDISGHCLPLYSPEGMAYYKKYIKPDREPFKIHRDMMTVKDMYSVLKTSFNENSSEKILEIIGDDGEDCLQGVYDPPKVFVKTDEVLRQEINKQGDSIKMKPRIITYVATHMYVETAVPIHFFYSHIKGVIYELELRGKRGIVLIGVPSASVLSEFMSRLQLHLVDFGMMCAGDDNWTGMWIRGKFYRVTTDFSMFDQSQREKNVLGSHYEFLKRLGLPPYIMASVLSAFGGNFAGKMPYQQNWMGVIWLYMQGILGSGNNITTVWNSFMNLRKQLLTYLIIMKEDLDETKVPSRIRWAHDLTDKMFGFESKVNLGFTECDNAQEDEFYNAVIGSDYLKGWFIPVEGRWFWSPLPSRLCKMFASDKPLNHKNFTIKNYNVAYAYYSGTPDPVLRGILKRFLDSIPQCYRIIKRDVFPASYWDYRIRPMAVQEKSCISDALICYERRYGLFAECVQSFAKECALQYSENASIYTDPVLLKFWETDY